MSKRLQYLNQMLLVLLLFVSSCKNSQNNKGNDVITTPHPLASLAGKKMFDQNGNAIDAAVAAAFALAVVEPSMSGIGGRLQVIYKTSEGVKGIDASTEVPVNYKPSGEGSKYGYKTIGIPGVVAGLLKLHEEGGNLSLSQVMEPAIKHAFEGYEILPGEAFRQFLEKDKIKEFDGTSFYFLKSDSSSYKAGDKFVQKDLGETLKRIQKNGHKGFYEGETAEMIAEDMKINGGLITLEDLKKYRALDAKVLKGSYKGFDVYSLFLPSYGAITIQILQIFDALNFDEKSEKEWVYHVGKTIDLAYRYRKKQNNSDSLEMIISKEKAKEWANDIIQKRILTNKLAANVPTSWNEKIGHTAHLTTADRNGNVVSLTQTIGPLMGSKVVTKNLGFLYAVTLGGYLGDYKPGDRANSHISPTLVSKGNEVFLALGAAGGSRIVTAITQVISRYFSNSYNLSDAVSKPRIYPDNDTLLLENHPGIKWDEGLEDYLMEKNYPYKFISYPAMFGRVFGIEFDSKTNRWIGVSDPDWEGTVESN
ncbi:MAG: gamma-glutamyltransferase [Bacteroidota bacterium]|nr:gamma-glutamyltransferase [Bacteroidota bacterium]